MAGTTELHVVSGQLQAPPEVLAAAGSPTLANGAAPGAAYPQDLRNASGHYCLLPANEAERQETVAALDLTGKEEDPHLKSIVGLVCRVLKFPMGAITIVNGDKLCYIATQGCPCFEQDRQLGLCAWSFMSRTPEAMVIEDTLQDARFMHNELVVDPTPPFPPLRAYAGSPLVASTGQRLGTLCVVDHVPHTVAAGDVPILTNLAEMVVRELEKDKLLQLQKLTNKRLLRTINSKPDPMLVVDIADPNWPIMVANGAWQDILGESLWTEDEEKRKFWQVFEAVGESRGAVLKRADRSLDTNCGVKVVVRHGLKNLCLQLRPTSKQHEVEADELNVGIPSFLATEGHHINTMYLCTPVPSDPSEANEPMDLSRASSLDSVQSWGSLGQSVHMLKRLAQDKGTVVAGSMELDFKEVQLDSLLTSEKTGKTFRGKWNDALVSVKVLRSKPDVGLPLKPGMLVPAEAAVSVELSHPHLVRGFRYAICRHHARGDQKAWNETWLVQEWCGRGRLIDAFLRGWLNGGPNSDAVDLARVLLTASEIASGLAGLHASNFVHGNLQGDSVWLAHADNARGFVAKLAAAGHTHPANSADERHPARALGTHAAPEVFEQARVSKASDVYALGVLVWEMCKQTRAFANLSWPEIHAAVTSKQGSRFQSLPADIQAVVDSCVDLDPAKRPQAAPLQREFARLAARNAAAPLAAALSSPEQEQRSQAAGEPASVPAISLPEAVSAPAEPEPQVTRSSGNPLTTDSASSTGSPREPRRSSLGSRKWSYFPRCFGKPVTQETPAA